MKNEKILKGCLKKCVKITLATLVAFSINGTLTYADATAPVAPVSLDQKIANDVKAVVDAAKAEEAAKVAEVEKQETAKVAEIVNAADKGLVDVEKYADDFVVARTQQAKEAAAKAVEDAMQVVNAQYEGETKKAQDAVDAVKESIKAKELEGKIQTIKNNYEVAKVKKENADAVAAAKAAKEAADKAEQIAQAKADQLVAEINTTTGTWSKDKQKELNKLTAEQQAAAKEAEEAAAKAAEAAKAEQIGKDKIASVLAKRLADKKANEYKLKKLNDEKTDAENKLATAKATETFAKEEAARQLEAQKNQKIAEEISKAQDVAADMKTVAGNVASVSKKHAQDKADATIKAAKEAAAAKIAAVEVQALHDVSPVQNKEFEKVTGELGAVALSNAKMIDANMKEIDANTVAINENIDAIATKAEKAYVDTLGAHFDTKVTDLEKEVSTKASKLSVAINKENIAKKADKTYVNGALTNLGEQIDENKSAAAEAKDMAIANSKAIDNVSGVVVANKEAADKKFVAHDEAISELGAVAFSNAKAIDKNAEAIAANKVELANKVDKAELEIANNGSAIKEVKDMAIVNSKAIDNNSAAIIENREIINNNSREIAQNTQYIRNLDEKVDREVKTLNKGISQVAAMGSIDFTRLEREEMAVGAGIGHYRNQQSVAVGVAYAPTDALTVNVKLGVTPGKGCKDVTVGAGGVYKFKMR